MMFIKAKKALILIISGMSIAGTVNATDYTINFDDPSFLSPNGSDNWGQVIDDEYISGNFGASDGGAFGDVDVRFWTSVETNADFNSVDLTEGANFPIQDLGNGKTLAPYLVLFNTQYTNSDDNDLEVGVNNNDGRASNYTGKNIAIINENTTDGSNEYCDTSQGTLACRDPDDRFITSSGAPHGGWVFIEFSEPVNLHSINLVDMESSPSQLGSIGYYGNSQNLLATQAMSPTTSNTNSATGDGGWITKNLNSALEVTLLVLRMQGSGGFDNLAFSRNTPPPVTVSEPAPLAIMALGLLGLAYRRKKLSLIK